jgi:nicotinamide riboside kinase
VKTGGCLIAVLGAESTGKTTLARALATDLATRTGTRVTWVPEVLREWCDAAGRTPRPHEQWDIARAQQARIDEAAARHAVVVCDTTAVMTAVYSALLFSDRSLEAWAAQAHARVALTLVTAPDLPWEADGLQRDGPHVQAPVDAAVRALLDAHALRWVEVAGRGPARLAAALAPALAVTQPLRQFSSDEPGG